MRTVILITENACWRLRPDLQELMNPGKQWSGISTFCINFKLVSLLKKKHGSGLTTWDNDWRQVFLYTWHLTTINSSFIRVVSQTQEVWRPRVQRTSFPAIPVLHSRSMDSLQSTELKVETIFVQVPVPVHGRWSSCYYSRCRAYTSFISLGDSGSDNCIMRDC